MLTRSKRTRFWVLNTLVGALMILAVGLWITERVEPLLAQQTSQAARLHEQAIVVDGHVHVANRLYWEGIDPWKAQSTGLFDFARAKQGGVDVVIEYIYIEDVFNNYNVSVKQALRLTETFLRMLDANRDKMELALTSSDVRRIVAGGKVAVILALEGNPDLEGDLDVLRLFYRLGVRVVEFTMHSTTNTFVDAAMGEQKWHGINDHGRAVIREMNRLGILIDVSHSSDAAALQIIEASRTPVVASHQGLKSYSNHPRNLSDEVLKAVAAKKGMVGMIAAAGLLSQKFVDWERARALPPAAPFRPESQIVRSPDQDYGKYTASLDAESRARWLKTRGFARPWRESAQSDTPVLTMEDWVDRFDYLVKLVGADHVGIGTDMQATMWVRDFDATSYPRLTEAFVEREYSTDVIRKILGENWLHLLEAAQSSRDKESAP